MVEDVWSVLAFHAFDDGGAVFCVVDEVDAGFVEGDGVGGSEDSDVVHIGRGGVSVAVAIDGDVVHDVDVDHVFGAFVGDDGL